MRKPGRALPALLLMTSSLLAGTDYGLPVGSKMPGFEAPDQDGKIHTLERLLGPKGAVILFYRSADW